MHVSLFDFSQKVLFVFSLLVALIVAAGCEQSVAPGNVEATNDNSLTFGFPGVDGSGIVSADKRAAQTMGALHNIVLDEYYVV